MSVLLQVMSLLLIVCMLLLLWGCSTRPTTVPLVTPEPPLLATVQQRTLPFVEALTEPRIARPAFVLPTAQPVSGLILPSPHCYRQAQHGVVCVGQVINAGLEAVERLRLRLRINHHTQMIAAEQRVIPAGGFAPYRVIFHDAEDDRASVTVDSLKRVHLPALPLHVLTEEGHYAPGRSGYGTYHYRATLRANDDLNQPWQAVVTLFTSTHQIVGYRVLEQNAMLATGDTLTLETSIIPLLIDTNYYTTLTIAPR